jgi:hypothetical protein
VIALLVVVARESALSPLFIGQNQTDRRVSPVEGDNAADGGRVFPCEIIIIVPLLVDFRVVRASRTKLALGPPPLPNGQPLSSRPTAQGNTTCGATLS